MDDFFQTDFDALGFEQEPESIKQSYSGTRGPAKGSFITSAKVRNKLSKAMKDWHKNHPEFAIQHRNRLLGYKHSDEARLKMSIAKKGRPSHNKGTKMSQEQKDKISATLNKPEVRQRKSDAMKKLYKERKIIRTGRKHSVKTRAKISKSVRGRTLSAEWRRKIGAARKGKRHSPETIAKIKATWARKRKKSNKE